MAGPRKGSARASAATALAIGFVMTSAGSAGAAGTDVMTFGQDTFGQLGNGSLGASPTPATVLTGASDVAGGREHALALAAGAVWAWGADDKQQVGDGSDVTSNQSPFRVITSGARAVTTGHYHSMALMNDGSVSAWGWNTKGQVGPGSSKVAIPTKVSQLGTATQVAAGRAHSLALVGGDVYTWGDNAFGQLGRTANTVKNPTPTKVDGLPSISFIAGGRDTSFAISTTGALWAWGNNSYGQAGVGTVGAGSATPRLVPGTGAYTHVESGADHTIARKTDGTVWTWGRNRYGQLGYSGANRAVPTRVTALSGITEVFAGRDHSIAVASNGSVYTWGRNDGGQLGVSSATVGERSTPTVVPALAGAVDAGGGQVYSIVLR